MKSILIVMIFYLCISTQFIECMQIKRVKKLVHSSHHVRMHMKRQQQKAKLELYAKITALFKHRDETLSMYADINAQMIKMWKILQADGTKMTEVNAEEEVLKKLYDKHMEEIKADNDKVNKQIAESQFFKQTFDQAKLIDEKYEKALLDQKQLEKDVAAVDSTLTKEQKDSQAEINIRKKFSIKDELLKGQQQLMRIFTDFLKPKKDAKQFKKNVIKAIENSMPDKFCYKKSSKLAAVQKLSCPTTHPVSSLGSCWETCDQGQARLGYQPNSKFEKFLGTCWEQCNTAKQPKCSKKALFVYPEGYSWTNWHWQRSFIPDFKTVFSKDVTCQEGEKKWGFLCYSNWQECKNIGYEDCGGLSCSLNKVECAAVIKDMVVETILGISKFSLLFVAPGASTIIQTASSVLEMTSKFADLIKSMTESRKLLVQVVQRKELKARIIKDAVSSIKENKQDIIDGVQLDDKSLYEKVNEILDQQVEKIKKKDSKTLEQIATVAGNAQSLVKGTTELVQDNKALIGAAKEAVKDVVSDKVVQGVKTIASSVGGPALQAVGGVVEDALEVFDISLVMDIIDMAKSCTKGTGVDCAKALLGPIANFDPTGLVGIARAFMYNTCKDPSDD